MPPTTVEPPPTIPEGLPRTGRPPRVVELLDGSSVDLSSLSAEQLSRLQWEQEPAFASAIAEAPKDSAARQQLTSHAYTTICAVLEELSRRESATSDFTMGMDVRYVDLILRLLEQQARAGVVPSMFELGFSSGALLQAVAKRGFDVGGLEVVEDLLQQTRHKLDAKHHSRLLLGDFRKLDLTDHLGRYGLVYWNDVFEHIPIDEIADYLSLLHGLLAKDGLLVTITPNWHMRPSDVTADFCPPRTEARGFHLREYTCGEVCRLLREAGFQSVTTPSWISLNKIYLSPLSGLTQLKVWCEPALEWLPYPLAVQACRRLGLNCTIARK